MYLHLAATGANVPIVTIVGDNGAIVATIAANIAAAAAYEARSTLLVDVDPTTSTIANVFRIPSNPGLAGIIANTADWPEAIMQTTVGRDRPLDVLPSGTKRADLPGEEVAQRIRGDFARMERRYDLIVITAPMSYLERGTASIIPAPDIVLCARVGRTKIAQLRQTIESLRALDLRIHGLVLWNDESPVIETQEENEPPGRSSGADRATIAEVR